MRVLRAAAESWRGLTSKVSECMDGEFEERDKRGEASQREAEEEGNGQESTSTTYVFKQNWHPVSSSDC